MRHAIAQPSAASQSGMSLFPALMFLLVLSVLGVSALSSTLMQEKMVSNTKDLNLAFQAAEAGLRDAEVDVGKNVNAGTVFSSACTFGLCTPPSTWDTPSGADISKLVDWSSTGNPLPYRVYGSKTGAPSLPDVAAQPEYVVEKLSSLTCGPGCSAGIGLSAANTGGTAYRLTVLATGVRPETRVILQSTFLVSNP